MTFYFSTMKTISIQWMFVLIHHVVQTVHIAISMNNLISVGFGETRRKFWMSPLDIRKTFREEEKRSYQNSNFIGKVVRFITLSKIIL